MYVFYICIYIEREELVDTGNEFYKCLYQFTLLPAVYKDLSCFYLCQFYLWNFMSLLF